jgi:hypothetical protein
MESLLDRIETYARNARAAFQENDIDGVASWIDEMKEAISDLEMKIDFPEDDAD